MTNTEHKNGLIKAVSDTYWADRTVNKIIDAVHAKLNNTTYMVEYGYDAISEVLELVDLAANVRKCRIKAHHSLTRLTWQDYEHGSAKLGMETEVIRAHHTTAKELMGEILKIGTVSHNAETLAAVAEIAKEREEGDKLNAEQAKRDLQEEDD